MLEDVLPDTLRRALSALPRARLSAVTDHYGIAVGDRRSVSAHVDAIIGARAVAFVDVLRRLSREELKAICAALGLDPSGREKNAIIERIAGVRAVGSRSGGNVAKNDGKMDGTNNGFELTSEPKSKKPRAAPVPRSTGNEPTADYRHEATRKNNPPAGLVDYDRPPPQPKKTYSYDPHLDPQLVWSGKAEHTSFPVDTVSLHIHERVSTQAIMRAVKREDAQRSLFAEPDLPASKEIDFYMHDVGWSNRLVLGDSLVVMNSLLEREHMAGKVQCIYVDPPYGVKFNSNFQPFISRRDVKDGDDGSLTREPEQIQAYRDTWTLGIHSYLTYLRDRFLLARELLHSTGSLFVQISDENLHHVRELLDEVYGAENFVALISFTKAAGGLRAATRVSSNLDYLIWYARDNAQIKYRPLYEEKVDATSAGYTSVELPDGTRRSMTADEKARRVAPPDGARPFMSVLMTKPGPGSKFDVEYQGRVYTAGNRWWGTTPEGIRRVIETGRAVATENSLRFVSYFDDFPYRAYTNLWTGLGGAADPQYVVQTNAEVIQRCILMTTDPGDLVVDPTCGSGTTAYVAEKWGRRWITCDTSRVAAAVARQRLLTSRFPYFRLRSGTVRDGFVYRKTPHITMASVAQNARLDSCTSKAEKEHLIRSNAEQEPLYDQPEEDRTKVRVSGPFTVEAIPVATMAQAEEPPIPQLETAARKDDIARPGRAPAVQVGADYVGYMIDLLKKSGGAHFKNGKSLPLSTLRAVKTAHEWLHAESETGIDGDPRMVAVSFGPRHAPVTPKQVLDTIQQTRTHDIVLFVGFACDPEALRMIEMGAPRRELHFVHAAPDILVGDLVKTSRTTKLFTVFGLPDVKVKRVGKDEVTVTLTGVDIYNPETGETAHDDGANVAAWFLDHDYDGRSFCICQAFFPNAKTKNPWERIQKALKGSIDEDRFEALRGTTSIPFKPGKKVAVKVIDDRGNEVVKVVGI